MSELIKYIESKGFVVLDQLDCLLIYKYRDPYRTTGRIWDISTLDREQTPWETLQAGADECMGWIDTQLAHL